MVYLIILSLPVLYVIWCSFPRRIQPDPQGIASFREAEKMDAENSTLGFQSKNVSVVIDKKTELVTFRRCHWSRKFWTLRVSPEFVCPYSDLLTVVEYFGENESWIEVTTTHGKATLHRPKTGLEIDQFEKVLSLFAAITIDKSNSNFTQSTGFLYVIAAICTTLIIYLILLN